MDYIKILVEKLLIICIIIYDFLKSRPSHILYWSEKADLIFSRVFYAFHVYFNQLTNKITDFFICHSHPGILIGSDLTGVLHTKEH